MNYTKHLILLLAVSILASSCGVFTKRTQQTEPPPIVVTPTDSNNNDRAEPYRSLAPLPLASTFFINGGLWTEDTVLANVLKPVVAGTRYFWDMGADYYDRPHCPINNYDDSYKECGWNTHDLKGKQKVSQQREIFGYLIVSPEEINNRLTGEEKTYPNKFPNSEDYCALAHQKAMLFKYTEADAFESANEDWGEVPGKIGSEQWHKCFREAMGDDVTILAPARKVEDQHQRPEHKQLNDKIHDLDISLFNGFTVHNYGSDQKTGELTRDAYAPGGAIDQVAAMQAYVGDWPVDQGEVCFDSKIKGEAWQSLQLQHLLFYSSLHSHRLFWYGVQDGSHRGAFENCAIVRKDYSPKLAYLHLKLILDKFGDWTVVSKSGDNTYVLRSPTGEVDSYVIGEVQYW
jgi:hypothetical protein